VYPETPIDYASSKIISGVKNLREGLDPDVLAYWYKRVEDRSKEIVPRHLNVDEIQVGCLKKGSSICHAGHPRVYANDAILHSTLFHKS
jgi:hypothetical protein